jgi:hypothetical protein
MGIRNGRGWRVPTPAAVATPVARSRLKALGRTEELTAFGGQAGVVAADALHLPKQHQVLDGVAHPRGEREPAKDEQRRQQGGHKRVQSGDHLGEEPRAIRALDTAPM